MAQPYAPPCQEGLIRAEPGPPTHASEASPARRRWVLAACILASSMAFIDGSALTVALPALRQDFAADLIGLQWVINAYVLALSALTLIGGALADAYGKARMLALGCVLFGAASIACALAPDVATLIAARALQGVGAAILTPSSLALIGATYPESERSGAIGAWAAASALTTAGGPLLGGWLTENFGWQAVFWINPPLAVAASVLVIAFAPAAPRLAQRFDIIGAGVLAAGLGALAYGLGALGETDAAGPPTHWMLATALILLIAFVAYESRAKHPMTPLGIFRNRPFSGLNAATLLVYAALSLMFFLIPFQLSAAYGLSATAIGAAFLPFTLGVGLLSRFFGKMADRSGPRRFLIGGPLIAAAAFAWMALGAGWELWIGMIAPMALLGLAFAIWVAPLTANVLSSLGGEQEGLASGINNAVSRIAQLVGVAAAAALGATEFGYAAGLSLAACLAAAGAAAAIAATQDGKPAPT